MSYFDIYKLRVNRYGIDYQSRVQGEREKLFKEYLLKSLYRVDFEYENNIYPGSFEKYKQDDTQTLHYLLTETSLNMPNGTILMIPAMPLPLMPPKKTKPAVISRMSTAETYRLTPKMPATKCSAVKVLATMLKKMPAQELTVASQPAGLP